MNLLLLLHTVLQNAQKFEVFEKVNESFTEVLTTMKSRIFYADIFEDLKKRKKNIRVSFNLFFLGKMSHLELIAPLSLPSVHDMDYDICACH